MQADYILILVSPVYRRVIDGTATIAERNKSHNALHIYRRVVDEYNSRTDSSACRRFIAIILPGCSKADVPAWLRDTGAVYIWPVEYINLFYCMMRPAVVVSNFLTDGQQQRQQQQNELSPGNHSSVVNMCSGSLTGRRVKLETK